MSTQGRRDADDFRDEIEAHIRLEADRLIEEGTSAEEALAAARRAFGNRTRARERFHESTRWIGLERFAQDVRYAFRRLAADPSFTLIAVLTLAVGIAAATAVFSVVYGILLAPLPYEEPDRLAQVMLVGADDGAWTEYLTGMDFIDLQSVDAIEALACSYNYRETGFNLETPAGTRRVRYLQISSGFFDLFGVRPMLGRGFRLDEERGEAKRVVISHGLWRNHFGGDPSVLGRVLRADGEGYEVIGVMPPGFQDAHNGEVDLWVPHNTAPGGENHRTNHYVTVLARLADGVTFAEAQRRISAMRSRMAEEDSRLAQSQLMIAPLAERVAGEAPPLLWVLTAASGLLLLIACVNLATMLMARAGRRERELATRAALGSSRLRIVRQLLTENLALATLGGIAGMGLGLLAVEGLLRIAPAALPRTDNVAFDWPIFLAGCGLTVLTAVLFGLIPSLRAGRVNLESALRESTRGGSAGAGRNRLFHSLIGAQVAMAIVVLVGAGLLTESFRALLENDLGISPENVTAFEVSLPDAAYPEGEDRARFYRELHRRVRALPGVEAVGSVSWLPTSGRFNIWGYLVDGEVSREGSDVRVVQGGYFEAMRIARVAGRVFDSRDRSGSALVIVVSESFARRHWPDSNAVGETVRVGGNDERTIVGVVRDTRYDHRVSSSPKIYIPHEQFADDRNWALTQVVRWERDSVALQEAVAAEIATLDPGLVLHHVRRVEDVVAGAVARDRFAMLLMSAFAWASLLLAAVGVYGLLSYVVAQRTREIGIRLALGAETRQILRSVLGRAFRIAVAGAAAGSAVAAAGSRALESMLYEVSPTDAVVFAGVAATVIVAALLAALPPAARAVGTNPVDSLRQD